MCFALVFCRGAKTPMSSGWSLGVVLEGEEVENGRRGWWCSRAAAFGGVHVMHNHQ